MSDNSFSEYHVSFTSPIHMRSRSISPIPSNQSIDNMINNRTKDYSNVVNKDPNLRSKLIQIKKSNTEYKHKKIVDHLETTIKILKTKLEREERSNFYLINSLIRYRMSDLRDYIRPRETIDRIKKIIYTKISNSRDKSYKQDIDKLASDLDENIEYEKHQIKLRY